MPGAMFSHPPPETRRRSMRLSRKLVIGTVILAFAVLALTARSSSTFGQLPDPQSLLDGDPIILKGGSLTIECPKYENCLPFNTVTKKLEHKEPNKKIQRIIIKDESGNVIANVSKVNFPNGKPTIEIYYK
jgi:hypothetical protein